MLTVKSNCKMADRCIAILKDEEPDKEYRLMCLSVDDKSFDDFKFESEPNSPAAYNSYKMLDNKKQKEYISNNPEFFNSGEVGDFIKKLSRIRSGNVSHKLWLTDCLRVFVDKKDTDRADKTASVLSTYPLDAQSRDPEVVEKVDLFKGTIVKTRKVFGYDD
jgi:hypothetical protein